MADELFIPDGRVKARRIAQSGPHYLPQYSVIVDEGDFFHVDPANFNPDDWELVDDHPAHRAPRLIESDPGAPAGPSAEVG